MCMPNQKQARDPFLSFLALPNNHTSYTISYKIEWPIFIVWIKCIQLNGRLSYHVRGSVRMWFADITSVHFRGSRWICPNGLQVCSCYMNEKMKQCVCSSLMMKAYDRVEFCGTKT